MKPPKQVTTASHEAVPQFARCASLHLFARGWLVRRDHGADVRGAESVLWLIPGERPRSTGSPGPGRVTASRLKEQAGDHGGDSRSFTDAAVREREGRAAAARPERRWCRAAYWSLLRQAKRVLMASGVGVLDRSVDHGFAFEGQQRRPPGLRSSSGRALARLGPVNETRGHLIPSERFGLRWAGADLQFGGRLWRSGAVAWMLGSMTASRIAPPAKMPADTQNAAV